MVLFGMTLTVLMAMSAFAVDVGMLFAERRENQSAADTGALAGALDLPSGVATASEAAAAIVRDRLVAEGVSIREYVKIERVDRAGNGVAVTILEDGETRRIEGSHLLVATGRRANVSGLALEAAGIDYGPRGITVDARLRTTNKRVFAIGDVAGGPQFTHVAGYHAGVVVRQALFHLPAKANHDAVPWVTYADPELAHVGLNAAEVLSPHFGSHVRIGAELAGQLRAERSGISEVAQKRLEIVVEQDVFELNVEVAKTLLVEGTDRGTDLLHHVL